MQTGDLIINLRSRSKNLKYGEILHCEKAAVVHSTVETGIQDGDLGPDEPHLMCETSHIEKDESCRDSSMSTTDTDENIIHIPIYKIENVFEFTDDEGLVEASKINSDIDKVRLDKDDIEIGSRYRSYDQFPMGDMESNRHSILDAIESESPEYDFEFYRRKDAQTLPWKLTDETYLYNKGGGLNRPHRICNPSEHRFECYPEDSAPWMETPNVMGYHQCERCEVEARVLKSKFNHENLKAKKRKYHEYIITCEHTFPFANSRAKDDRPSLCDWIAIATPRSIGYCFGDNQGSYNIEPRSVNSCPACRTKSDTTFKVHHIESDLYQAIQNVLLEDDHDDPKSVVDAIFGEDFTDRHLNSDEIQEIKSEYSELTSSAPDTE